MSKKELHIPAPSSDEEVWEKALSGLEAEIATSKTLTEEEKRFLLEEMDHLSDDEWEPITGSGEPKQKGFKRIILCDIDLAGL